MLSHERVTDLQERYTKTLRLFWAHLTYNTRFVRFFHVHVQSLTPFHDDEPAHVPNNIPNNKSREFQSFYALLVTISFTFLTFSKEVMAERDRVIIIQSKSQKKKHLTIMYNVSTWDFVTFFYHENNIIVIKERVACTME